MEYNDKPEYIRKNSVLFHLMKDIYGKEIYVACPYPYHYYNLNVED